VLRRASVRVPQARAEEARAAMLALFPEGFEELEHADGLELAAYTDERGEARLAAHFGAAAGEDVEPGWEERWRRFHRPARVGPFWIGPPWEEPEPGLVPVKIEPGRAFGTGAHATTRLCLELLLTVAPGSLLDVGCGSGVIAIAAAKAGYGPVVAIDDDAVAVEEARRNARANDVALDIRCLDALAASLPEADVAVINISLAAAEAVAARLECAHLVTSGYLEGEAPRLGGYTALAHREADGWAADVHARDPAHIRHEAVTIDRRAGR
jgi:ribosomal protein L11 methyltransferase